MIVNLFKSIKSILFLLCLVYRIKNECKVMIEGDTEVIVTFMSNKSKKYPLKVIVQKGGMVSTDDLNIGYSFRTLKEET